MGEPRCVHDLLLGQCAACKRTPPGLPARVTTSGGGNVFHRNSKCLAFVEGQAKAMRAGYANHPAKSVPVSSALGEGRGACIHCFPQYRPDAQGAKPCLVLSKGTWVPGSLLEWRRDAEQRWQGVVAFLEDDAVVTRLIDQASLKSA
jgi:hypothetical protein